MQKESVWSLLNSAVRSPPPPPNNLGLAPILTKDDVKQHATSSPFSVAA